MTPTEISLIVFARVFAGALLGMFLRVRIPEHHLRADTENVIKLGLGLIATMAALVLGLLIAMAKSSYETQDAAGAFCRASIGCCKNRKNCEEDRGWRSRIEDGKADQR